MINKKTKAVALLSVGAMALAACSSEEQSGEASSGDTTITVAYQKTESYTELDDLLQSVKIEFEEANPGVTVDLQAIEAEESDYKTKLALMNGSDDTAPDVMYEDSSDAASDAAAGYLLALDDYLAEWEDWELFEDAAKEAGKGQDGKIYGVSMGTDTRGIIYNKEIFEQAGLPTDWQPTTWEEILDAARTIKENVPDVTPLNIYAGQAGGEQTSMQGFEMLLYGTDSTLYDEDTQQWITGSTGFIDALTFYQTVYSEELGPSLDLALDSNVGTIISTESIPAGEVAISIDGSWTPGNWISGDNQWDEWESTIGFAAMPTQYGQDPGYTSMSGGWLLSVGSQSENPDLAVAFVEMALNKENSLTFDTTNSQIAVRSDVAEDEEYLSYNSSNEFFSDLVQYTHFRPATEDYTQVSSNIQSATESVVTGDATPEEAASTYDEDLISLVGEESTVAGD